MQKRVNLLKTKEIALELAPPVFYFLDIPFTVFLRWKSGDYVADQKSFSGSPKGPRLLKSFQRR